MDGASVSAETCSLTVADIGDDPGQVLIRDENSIFKPLRTIPLAVLQIILQAGLFAESIWLFQFSRNCVNETITSVHEAKLISTVRHYKLNCVSLLIYSYSLLWVFALMFHWWRRFLHRDRRNMGYLLIYESVSTLSRVPFTAMSIGGFLLLIVLSLKRDNILFIDADILGQPLLYLFLEILTGLEFLVTLLSLAIYSGRVHRFNVTQPVPDVFNETNISSMPVIFNSRSIAEIGPGIQDCNKDIAVLQTVCERQGDLIKYLRRRCDVLCETLQDNSRRVA